MAKELSIATDHPSLAGHFPANPVVPGVVLLEQVKCLATELLTLGDINGYNNIKFLRPVLASQKIRVEFEDEKNNKIKFSCRYNLDLVLQGEIELSE